MGEQVRYEAAVDPAAAIADLALGGREWTLKLNRLLHSMYEQGRADERKLMELGHYDEVMASDRDESLPDREELQQVLRQVIGSRTATFTISLENLVKVCRGRGLFSSLPSLGDSGLTELWRDTLRSAFCGPGWTANRRRWRVTCRGEGDFWVRYVPFR